MIAAERLFLNRERNRVVRQGDPAAAFLLAAEGSEVPSEYLKLVEAAISTNTESDNEPKRQTRVAKPLRSR